MKLRLRQLALIALFPLRKYASLTEQDVSTHLYPEPRERVEILRSGR